MVKGIQEMMEEDICACLGVMMGRTLGRDLERIYIKKAKVRGIYISDTGNHISVRG